MSSSTVEHFSHPEHPLVLKEDVVIRASAECCVCNKPVIGSPTYTCSSDDIDCEDFYLHKSCAELPKQIIRDKLDPHPLALQSVPQYYSRYCYNCKSRVKFSYACDDCRFDLCVVCAFISTFVFEQKVIHHEGHKEHTLTLLRQALFRCDACCEEAKDYSYVCYTCDFWIHEKCSSSPPTIPTPTYHHHPLNLIFSIPVEHRYFVRECFICKERVHSLCWSYYCHKCTFFVHMKCSTSTVSLENEIEENDVVDNEPDLVEFPLPDEESIFDLIITQCSKFQVKLRGDHGENSANISTIPDDPHIIEKHWSHPDHPLKRFTVSVNDNDDENNDEDTRVLICDGCVQPITVSHPCYYSCIQCGFFLHSFCATKLPRELPAGASPFHPQHSLFISQMYDLYDFEICNICRCVTNGFIYKCETCDIKIDIRCAFSPERIRYKSHKHPLVQRPSFSDFICSVSNFGILKGGVKYACITCSTFQISTMIVFYPSKLKHRYDDHSLILRYPPFFCEGVIYCQICEERVNNQNSLYHCEECDQPFHNDCLISGLTVKFGRTIEHSIGNQPHTLAMVLKETRRNSPPYLCGICGVGYDIQFFFECEGCGYLACINCITRKYRM